MLSSAGITFISSFVRGSKGRGIVLAPGIPIDGPRVHKKAPLELRLPDGSKVSTMVAGLERLNGGGQLFLVMPVLLTDLTKEDVPIGTEVWTV